MAADSPDLATERARVKARFEELRGFWDPLWDPVLDADPELLDAYIDLSAVPWKHGTLRPQERELIYVAMNASTTHLYEIGVRVHLRNAIAHGATADEAMAVLAIVSELGVDTMRSTLPVLASELAERAEFDLPDLQTDSWTEAAGRLAPHYLDAYRRYAQVTRKRTVLRDDFCHLVAIAAAAAATHLHMPAVREHIRAALDAGVPWQQIVEVLEVVAMIGVHTLTECARVVADEFASVSGAERDER
ncbi:alkylhydroperoxidase/carboxymuconolactone decarboxylase family protein YurZ [Tamaricihabitans halophyticus]|uniref:Alkylhydroperoxidase/carboxymuconolactone decarboxylase family protein YurZ n=1 Tax=Tamaricihabitans halophyticus TaxID=1262583 RepID=A0A4V2SUN4_9PSEU|nr:carboxymuconolactone decarboxylase family protein [Tamaricihabitans halophyticus]TCP55256.1 alkylhydroperoxidase/carboxymuconolactone decarboxylase family protein YurZ [Tamaricihabitans halophyticus]